MDFLLDMLRYAYMILRTAHRIGHGFSKILTNRLLLILRNYGLEQQSSVDICYIKRPTQIQRHT